MAEITNDRQLREIRKLTFCYSCGRPLDAGSTSNRDHVPPKAAFHEADRISPLILPAHEQCNGQYGQNDEKIAQLLGPLSNRFPSPQNVKLKLEPVENDAGALIGGIAKNVHMGAIIARWLRACHAALYHEYLPLDTPNYIHSPFLELTEDDSGRIEPIRPMRQQLLFSQVIRRNRLAQSTDRILAWNAKFQYECVWDLTDSGDRWMCIYAFRVYDWEVLGHAPGQVPRGCVGHYMPRTGRPRTASRATRLSIPLVNPQSLDPFVE